MLTDWKPGNRILQLTAVVLFLNGAAPYLGMKFEYSFAMLSNLRVDDARWNHVLVPRWVRLTKNDAFVHLRKFRVDQPPSTRAKAIKPLSPALHVPWVVADRLNELRQSQPGANLELDLTFAGRAFSFAGRADDPAVKQWLATLPAKNRFFQNQLALEGPQGCCH